MIDFKTQVDFYNIAGSPPDEFKYWSVRSYQRKFGYNVLVETGTYVGNMIRYNVNNFKRIISVELNDRLYADAIINFSANNNVELLHGDSGCLMPDIIKTINEPAIFYLDAHEFGCEKLLDGKISPILDEINVIINQFKYPHVILIDDARLLDVYTEYAGGINRVLDDLSKKYYIKVCIDFIEMLPK